MCQRRRHNIVIALVPHFDMKTASISRPTPFAVLGSAVGSIAKYNGSLSLFSTYLARNGPVTQSLGQLSRCHVDDTHQFHTAV